MWVHTTSSLGENWRYIEKAGCLISSKNYAWEVTELRRSEGFTSCRVDDGRQSLEGRRRYSSIGVNHSCHDLLAYRQCDVKPDVRRRCAIDGGMQGCWGILGCSKDAEGFAIDAKGWYGSYRLAGYLIYAAAFLGNNIVIFRQVVTNKYQ